MEYSLVEAQLKRAKAIEKHKDFIENLTAINSPHRRQKRFRRWFKNWLIYTSTKVFENEDEEYKHINKFGRGAWEMVQLKKTFTSKAEFDIVCDISQDFGAWDY